MTKKLKATRATEALTMVEKKLKEKLTECEKLKDEYLVGWQRERADFLNYKKENTQRITTLIQYANANLIVQILPVLDNLERLEKGLPQNFQQNEYFQGVLQTKKEFLEILKNQGIEPIQALGEKFNPDFHEVVEEIKKEKVSPQTVVEEVERGYRLHGKVIRPAKVKIAQ